MRTLIFSFLLLASCGRTEVPKETGVDDDSGGDSALDSTDADGDGFSQEEDCNDSDPAVNPDARELCDGIDNDCDGLFDDEDSNVFGTDTWYPDYDLDGYGEDRLGVESCEQPSGYVDNNLDCLDTNGDVHLDADEICDGIDNDCDGVTDGDDATDAHTWYIDEDADGYGTHDSTVSACDPPAGYALHDNDCDDSDPSFHPGALETDCADPTDYNCDGSVGFEDADADGFAACEDCDDTDANANDDALEVCDGIDNDCDGDIDSDDGSVTGTTTFYGDADGDGYGGAQFQAEACEAPPGYVTNADDCDDVDASSHPGASEVCDDADNDCDSDVDEGVGATWYQDSDSDGYGNGSVSVVSCDAPIGYVGNALDCDDYSSSTNPGSFEVCDSADNDCDGSVDEDAINATDFYVDADSDGFGSAASSTSACDAPTGFADNDADCNDADSAVNPSATELCDSIDNDCDGSVDESGASGGLTWFRDLDADGFGNPASDVSACTQPSGYVADATDCDDTSASINTSGTELCDLVDNDCDGTVDEDDAADAPTWYVDSDSDGYGSTSTTISCSQPSGHVANSQDCDDGSSTLNPGTVESCDGLDNNCSGSTDEGLEGSGALCPSTSCQAILSAGLSNGDGNYWVDPTGAGSFEVYCDMTTDSGGWLLSYIMCQDGGGDAVAAGLSHATPITPTTSPVSSIPYATVNAMSPSTIRFTSDFTGGVGYKFDWSTITSDINSAQILLDGTMTSRDACQAMGSPISGSSGATCSMLMEHNNGGDETNDIPTLGCGCHVWQSDGMLWGQIDSVGNYNGVSHLSSTGWDHSPMTTNGCLLAYVR